MRLLSLIFTWWNSQTIGTWWTTLKRGREVGRDAQDNRYFEEKRSRKGERKRRWVIYAGLVEASRVPPEWHAWLHYMVDEVPAEAKRAAWEKPHRPNLTGTAQAYRPPGSLEAAAVRPPATGDYEAWRP
ncbi:MAG: NADH:ubiquinone oxidoreductase subunit NDUFA12 [Alphaproteobacteria bacterium]|nr:NADH:ubiquinone oxidoreductase subunit NDUFA12 [Alphaproteobacteria bacterium]